MQETNLKATCRLVEHLFYVSHLAFQCRETLPFILYIVAVM